MLGGTVVRLEPVGMEAEIDKNSVGLIDGHDLDALGIKLQIGFRQDLLQGLNQCAHSTGLDSADLEKITVGVGVGDRAGHSIFNS